MPGKSGILTELKITVLVEERAGFETNLLGQHGISFFIEAHDQNNKRAILFDTGQSSHPVLYNMKQLSIYPSMIDVVFLSHCHFDHTAGLTGILESREARTVPILAHPGIFRPHFIVNPVLSFVGLSSADRMKIQEHGGELLLSEEPMVIMNGVISTGTIDDRVSFEATPTLTLKTLQNGKPIADLMYDDMSLVFTLKKGLVIVTGCSHSGIVSIIKKAVKLTGIPDIAAVIGGFHLVDAETDRINNTLVALWQMNIKKIITGHCTGYEAESRFMQKYGDRFERLYTGKSIVF